MMKHLKILALTAAGLSSAALAQDLSKDENLTLAAAMFMLYKLECKRPLSPTTSKAIDMMIEFQGRDRVAELAGKINRARKAPVPCDWIEEKFLRSIEERP